ncbi:MAG: metallophosphoesterase family protein [Akkermansiaceae bacterium]|nr:metallophosphoesterase family protein [Akkermansiaceae bacterium]
MKRLTASIIFAAIAMAGPAWAGKDESAEIAKYIDKLTKVEGTTPAQWRITWVGDASSEAIISWSTAEPGETHTLYYDTQSHGTDVSKYKFQQACQQNGQYSRTKRNAGPDTYYHHAKIGNLKPATTYHFVMKSDGDVSRPLHFITAPESGTGFSVIHGGDSRSGHLARCQMNAMIADMAAEDESILALIHGGDFVKVGFHRSPWLVWMSQHELTTTPEGRVLPIIPAQGNHDGGPLIREVFPVNERGDFWYTTTLGKDLAVITLYTSSSLGGTQGEWLEKELKRLRPQTKWLLANYHRPIYPAVKGPKHTKLLAPLFEKYNLDLACESDGHCIKRTVPIRDGKKDPTGVTYIGEGGLGVGQRDPMGQHWYLKDGGVVGKGHHLMRLDFTDETLRIRTIMLGGEVFDDHSLKIRK